VHAGHRVGGIIAVMDADAPEDLLRRGREALTAAEWATARSCFEQALELSETGTALNGLGQAAHFQGRHLEAIEATERAFAAYRREDNPVKAAEMARWLAFLHGAVHGNFAAASGWMAWAERLLEGVEECVEHGRLALDRAPWTDDPAERERLAMAAVTIARRFGDRDLEFSAQALLGHAYVASGRVEEGMSLIDEAMAAIPAGEVARIDSIGEIYCRLLGACELATDVRRAEQWIATARRFVQWGDFVPPTCRLHHGGILIQPPDVLQLHIRGENAQVIPVRAGALHKQLTDRYFEGSTAIAERFDIQGRIDAARAVGQFKVQVNAKRPDGTGYRCSVGPIAFTAVN
jgi:tetratricopeptide (TPR) repeat protein